MSYAVPPEQSQTRPASVTTATLLMYAVVVLQVIGIIVSVAIYPDMKKAYELAFKDTTAASTAGTIATVTVFVGSAVSLLLAIGYGVLAMLVGRGKNVARIITWVVTGISLCCFGSNIASSSGSMNFGSSGGNGGPDPKEVARVVKEALPSWLGPVTVTIAVVEMLLAVLIIVLLLLPSANAFFSKKPPQVWEPPVPPAPQG
jgi:hypothetical protein